jgi:hemin uptake protein HemP
MEMTDCKNDDDDAAPQRTAAGEARPVVRYSVEELLRGGREAVLEHNGAEYRLRITANGRLILTK